MKVNKALFRFLRRHKKLCDSSEIDYIITDDHNEVFYSEFRVKSFGPKFFESNFGRKSKESCVIKKTEYGSFLIRYYDKFKEHNIELFPNSIKRVIYNENKS